MIVKAIIKKVLSMLDVGVYRISKGISIGHSNSRISAKPPIDPILHNSRDNYDQFFGDPQTLKEYLSEERIEFYRSVSELCVEHGFSFERKRVADVGCGPGELLRLIDEQYRGKVELTGFEYSPSAIEAAKQICPQASFYEFDIYKTQVPGKFDLVFCTQVLEHLLHPGQAIAKCASMLVPGGGLVLTVPDGRLDTFGGHINYWSLESWRIFIETNCQEFQQTVGMLRDGNNYAIIKRAESELS